MNIPGPTKLKKMFPVIILMLLLVLSVARANGAEVTLAWDANTEDNLAGYKLYYNLDESGAPYDGTGLTEGDSPVVIYLEDLDDSQSPVFELTGLSCNTMYYFALTAFDEDGLESDYSDEVSYESSCTSEDFNMPVIKITGVKSY